MSHDVTLFGFPFGLRLTHYINFLLLTLLIRRRCVYPGQRS